MDPRYGRVTVALLLLLSAVVGVAGAASEERTGAKTERGAAKAPQTLELAYEVERIPDRPGFVKVRFRPEIPAAVERLEVTLDDGQTVLSHAGFERTADRTWEWRGDGVPALTYVASVNRSAGRGYNAVDTPEWTLTSRHRRTVGVRFRYWYRGATVQHRETIEARGEGIAGVNHVYLGEYATATRAAGDQQFRLVVPDAARMRATPSAVLDSLAAASSALRVGGRDPKVTVFVGPKPMRGGGQTSEYSTPAGQDSWVNERARVDTPNNIWVHEYVHTRQAYVPGDGMAWFDEASAEYYAALLTLNAGGSDFESFRRHVTTGRFGGAVLADRSTWSGSRVQYRKGAHVLAALDARIRAETNGERTLQHVMRRMNEHRGKVTVSVFRDIVAAVVGQRMDAWIDRYVGSGSMPAVPDAQSSYVVAVSADADGDGLDGDAESAHSTSPFASDTDGDGLDDGRELDLETDPTVVDTDGDGLPDGDEVEGRTDPRATDTDDDGLADGIEIDGPTDPSIADTDGDGLGDGRERDGPTNPSIADTDDDGIDDGRELELGTNAAVADTDGDGLADGIEVDDRRTDPLVGDTDADGLRDDAEVREGTNPLTGDSDGDGIDDGRERQLRTDPTQPTGQLTYYVSLATSRLATFFGISR